MLRARVAASVLLSLTALVPLFGQDEDDPQPAVEKPIERLIYVPYKDLKATLEKVDRTIFLPYAEYVELVRRAERDRRRALDGPGAILTSSKYAAKVEDDHVRIAATFAIEATDGPWAEVPVTFGRAAVGKITSPDDQPDVLLRGRGEGEYAFVLPEKGTYEVTLELLARVKSSPDGRGFAMNVPSVGITSLELEVPVADQEVTVEPEAVVLPANDDDDGGDATKVTADLGAVSQLAVGWSPRAGLEPEMDLLASVENALSVSFADRLVNARAVLSYRVLRGELAAARVVVPDGHRVLDVSSADVELKGWTSAEEDGNTVVTATLLSPAKKPFTLEVRTEGPLADDAFAAAGIDGDGTAHGIHALDVVRESGRLVVVPDTETNLVVETTSGLVRIEAADVPEGLRFSRGRYFRFFEPNFDLTVDLVPIEPRIVVETRAAVALQDDRLETETFFTETIERTGVFERTYEIPVGHEVVDVVGDRRRDHTFDEATRTLRVALLERFRGTHAITVRTRAPFDPATKQDALALAVPQPIDVDRETGRIDVLAIPGVAVRTDETKLVGLVPSAGSTWKERGDARAVSTWSFTKRPVELVVGTVPRPTRLSATVATTLDVKREIARVSSRLDYTIEYAGVGELRFAVPESVVDGLTVTDGSKGAVDWRPDAADAGWVPIRVLLDGKTLGRTTLLVEYDLPPGGEAIPEPQPAAAPAEEPAAGDDADADDADADDGAGGGDADDGDDADDANPDGGNEDEDAADDGEVPEPRDVPAAEPAGDRFVLQPPRVLAIGGDGEGSIPVAEVRGEVAVLKERVLSVEGRADGPDLEAVDVRELEFHGTDDAALAYRYVSQQATVAVHASVHEIEEVVETVVTRALVEVVTSRGDDRASFRCRYRLLSSERQRLAIQLPVNAEVLGAFVDDPQGECEHDPSGATRFGEHCAPVAVDLEKDESTQPEENYEAFTVSVARRAGSDEPFHLTLLFRWPLSPKPFASYGGRLTVPMPRIGGEAVPTQRLRTVVWLPDEYALVGTPDAFTGESNVYLRETILDPLVVDTDIHDLEEWIGGDSVSLFEFPTQGRAYLYSSVGGPPGIVVSWWHMPFVTWVLGLGIAAVAFVLRGTTWENKLGILVVAGVALAAYALADRDSALHLLVAARFGLVALAALWVIHFVLELPEAWRTYVSPGRPRPLGEPVAVVSPPPPKN